MAVRRLGKDIVRDKRFGMKNVAQNSSGLLWGTAGAAFRSRLEVQNVAKGASRTKINLHLDTYFHVRSGSGAFGIRYYNG